MITPEFTTTTVASSTPTPQQVVHTMSWALQVSPQRLLPYMNFVDDLHLDDLDMLLLVATLENALDVYLTQEQVTSIHTVADMTRSFSPN
ncbi:MAG: hypothetical protein AAGJ82_04940 [Bacteroidota bacterium]